MSTDILQYLKIPGSNAFGETYSATALRRYLTITLSLMTMTFTAWYVVYWWVDSKQRVGVLKEKVEKMNRNRAAM